MLGIKKYLLHRWAPDYDKLQQENRLVGFYERFFPRFLDPQVVKNQLPRMLTTDGEIKEVCVLFTDVRGFTAYSEKNTLRAANSLLNNFYDMVIHHTQVNGGIVDKFMGDGTMCIFGAFDNDDSYVIRAVAAAQAILRDFIQMTTQKHEPNLFLGAAITKGPAIVGMFGNGEYVSFTAIGSTVNLAARVQTKADNNNLLVTKEVTDYLPEHNYVSKGKHAFKNVTKKVEVFEVDL